MSTTSTLSFTNMEKPVIMDPSERIKRYGIECVGPNGDGIVFAAGKWKPGGEYIQKLIVRNVTTTVKKLKYRLPSTRYFSLAYPEVIVLSPGMFKELDVVFRPVQNNPYDDTIYFKMIDDDGGFHVPVIALISKLQVAAPFGLDFGFCATHQTKYLTFQLENFGEVDAPFRWEVPLPFRLKPESGIIPVGHKQDIEVSICPTDASVFVSQALCYVGEGVHAIIPEPVLISRFSAIGKYAYIHISDERMDFGEVLSGTPPDQTKKEIILRNQGVVPAEFELLRADKDRDELFNIQPTSGIINPLSEIPVTIKFSAKASGMFSLDEYIYKTPGNCTTQVSCLGLSMPPKVKLHKDGTDLNDSNLGTPIDSINFNDVELGSISTRLFFLKNYSNRNVTFHIIADQHGTFQFFPIKGEIHAEMEAPVRIQFLPTKPLNYYRRVFILISDALPILVDLMGTGFIRANGEIKEQRPAPIRHAHVQAYRNRCIQGIGNLNPDELDAKLAEEGVSDLFAKVGLAGTRPVSVALLKSPLTRSGEASRVDIAPAEEFFINDDETFCRGVTIDSTELDFGYTSYQSNSPAKIITVTNHTRGKVAIAWFAPALQDYIGQDGNQTAFIIEPPTDEIPPGKNAKFKIIFNPFQSNRNYFCELEMYAYFKNQRTFRLVNDATLTPPWCLIVRSIGHTFASGQLPSKVKLLSGGVLNGKLMFPTCHVGDSIYQIVKLKNSSNLSCTFNILLGFNNSEFDSGESMFTVKPTSGEIAPEDFALVCVRFTPASNKKYVQLVRCLINGTEGGTLLVEATGAFPQLSCPDVNETKIKIGSFVPGSLYAESFFSLNPTCIGLSSTRTFRLKNCSRLPLRYYCYLPSRVNDVITINKSQGFIKANDVDEIIFQFSPRETGRITCKMTIKVFSTGGQPSKVIDGRQPGRVSRPQPVQEFKVNIAGQGGVGVVVFDPPRLATDVKLVNTTETRHIVLENVSENPLSYELLYKLHFVPETGSIVSTPLVSDLLLLKSSSKSIDGTIANHQSLYCDLPGGILPARSRTSIQFTFHPNRAGLFDFIVFCRLKSVDENGFPVEVSNEELSEKYATQLYIEKRIKENSLDTIQMLPLTMAITGRASFPTLIIDDIRPQYDCLISDVSQLWRQFSVAQINHELHLPLTDEEVHINTDSSPNLQLLKRFPLNFTPDVINSPRQTYFVQLRNNGFLTTTLKFHLPNEKELDLEPWCDEEELTEERMMQISILEELKVFEIEPREAILEPGMTLLVSISYSHSSLKYGGLHRLPILLKLSQGKQIWLDCIGRTLDTESNVSVSQVPTTKMNANDPTSSLMCIAFAENDSTFRFVSTPIGLPLDEQPMQRMEIVNVSGCETKYEVDVSTIRQINKENYDREIFTILNPKGVIAPHSSLFLEWIFVPWEAKLYELPIVIKYMPIQKSEGKEVTSRRKSVRETKSLIMSTRILNLNIKAVGFDSRYPRPLPEYSDRIGSIPPNKRLVEVPMLGVVSNDAIDFGLVPRCYSSSRMFVIRSSCSTHDVEFTIDTDLSYLSNLGLLSITPTNGILSPYESATIELLLTANIPSAVLQDRIKVVLQTVIKPVPRKNNGSRHDKIRDRLKSAKKIGSTEHESVIGHPTFTRSQYINKTIASDSNKQAKYPTTVLFQDSATSSSRVLTGSPTAGNLMERTSSEGALSSNNKSVSTPFSSNGSKLLSRGGLDDIESNLRGPPEVYVVRLTVETYSYNTVTSIFQLNSSENLLNDFIAPKSIPFVPPRVIPQLPKNIEDDKPPASSGGGKNRGSVNGRESEVRHVLETLLFDLFKDVLKMPETHEQITRAVMTPAMGLSLPLDNRADLKPEGGAVYGVYFQEVIPAMSLTMKLIEELRYLGISFGSHGDKGKMTSDGSILKTDLLRVLVEKFELPVKGNAYKHITSILASDRNDEILLREFVPALSEEVSLLLEKKTQLLANKRQAQSKMLRQSTRRNSLKFIARDNSQNAKVDPPKFAKAAKKVDTLNSDLLQRHASRLMFDQGPDGDDNMTEAVQKIQNAARGMAARVLSEKKKEDVINSKVTVALTQEDFMEICGEIMRNTLLNLMDEAVHDEFPVIAEPIKFYIKENVDTSSQLDEESDNLLADF